MAEKKELKAAPPAMVDPIKGVTSTGFAFCYDADRLDDMDLYEMTYRADNGDPMGGKQALAFILGEDTLAALYVHLREKEGRVRWSSLYKALIEICRASRAGKN